MPRCSSWSDGSVSSAT
ncbi:unnamed protein product [Acanthoscelides obtectus]|uniref:Uncharacterized protein n=1 Tax=Acanthoscelides obtectus TaxID=200917 RepID=A0A9P0NV83_ACAOB|nr:unnamed protein product [Acanthoscelides obtectus]CAK1621848.1 hypothetical protein AOBTE_LOCUS1167 [Acanthoscelides obtectus]